MSEGQVTREQLTDIIEGYFRNTALGVVTSYSMIPSNVVWEMIASAMGGVLSGATKGPDLAATMAARGHLSDIVAKAIRKRYPAMDMTPANAIPPANQNGASVVKFPQ